MVRIFHVAKHVDNDATPSEASIQLLLNIMMFGINVVAASIAITVCYIRSIEPRSDHEAIIANNPGLGSGIRGRTRAQCYHSPIASA